MFPEEFLPVEIKLEFGFSGRWLDNCKQLPSGSMSKIIFLGVLGKILVGVLSIVPQKMCARAIHFWILGRKAAWWRGKAWVWELDKPEFSQFSFSSDGYRALSRFLDFSESYLPYS